MNTRDKKKLARATELAASSIRSVVDAYVRVLGTLVDNEVGKCGRLPRSLLFSPAGMELQDSICYLQDRIDNAERILFSRVMGLSGKEDVFGSSI